MADGPTGVWPLLEAEDSLRFDPSSRTRLLSDSSELGLIARFIVVVLKGGEDAWLLKEDTDPRWEEEG